jgi:protein-S-isoprenylcysteine O-methyltransferase Ste14
VSAALPRLSIPYWGATAASVVAALIPAAQLLIPKAVVVNYNKGWSMEYILLVVLWITFCAMHSALISTTFTNILKQKVGNAYRFHRLFYNIFSIVTLIPVVLYTLSIKQQPFFVWDGYLLPLKYILMATGIIFFIMGAKRYSFSQFAGIRQIGKGIDQKLINKTGKLSSKGILGAVRHPLYAALFPLIWARNIDITFFIVNIMLSAYLIIGTILEERKLVLEFGDTYREYQQKVSMLFPFKFIKAKLL